MTVPPTFVVCAAYVLGLLVSGMQGDLFSLHYGPYSLSSLTAASAFTVLMLAGRKRWKLGLSRRECIGVAAAFWIAVIYMPLRSPAPGLHDISHYVDRAQAIAPTHVVFGQVIQEPQLNRALKGRFLLAVEALQVQDVDGTVTFQIPTNGRLYVTAPLLQTTGLHAGQWVHAEGHLYLPQPAMNPNGFDFKAYLEQQTTFAGFVANQLHFPETRTWGLWQVRQRIIRTQIRALGSPLGQLVSSMALGRKAVDLPFDIGDVFSQVGLAHTVAASGFHVSLLLGSVLTLLRSRAPSLQAAVGLLTLVGYVTLTGFQTSVARAAIMGTAALAGLISNRKVRPVGALLAAVTILLLINPHWIWAVGFQLSVMATLGLIVMVPVVTKWLDWLPITVASLIAVPISATLWTLPLTLYHFNTFSGISIGLNAIATPLVTLISLGGIGSSAVSLLSPVVGELLAQLLYYPATVLLWLARSASRLPGASVAVQQISIWQLAGLYGILLLGLKKGPSIGLKRWLPVGFLSLIVLPMAWQCLTQSQVTVLSAGGELAWVMQERGKTTLVSAGDEDAAFYTIAPFLKQAGINSIESAIAPSCSESHQAGWQTLLRQVSVARVYSVCGGQSSDLEPESSAPEFSAPMTSLAPWRTTPINSVAVQVLGTDSPLLRLSTPQQTWLLLPSGLSPQIQHHLAANSTTIDSDVLVWDGGDLDETFLEAVAPDVAIAYGRSLSATLERQLRRYQIQVFWTERDGAIVRRRSKFEAYLNDAHREPVSFE